MPEHVNKFPNRDDIFNYLKSYIEVHKLNNNVYYNQQVTNVLYNRSTDLWEIEVQNLKSLKFMNIKSKYLAVCSGFYNKPNIIDLPQQNNFDGLLFHSKEFSYTGKYNYDIFQNKKIVFIGNGPTGCDLSCAAVENGADSVTLLYKTNRWILNRGIGPFKLDLLLSRFFLNIAIRLPTSLFLTIFVLVYIIPCRLYNIPIQLPSDKINRNNVAINNRILSYFSTGQIDYKKNTIQSISGNTIILDNNQEIDADIIVLCTGYRQETRFFDDVDLNRLYKRIVPLNYRNCGFIGFAPSFNWVQTSDLQSRWFLNWIKNNEKTTRKNMIKEIISTHKYQKSVGLEYFDLSYEPFNYLDNLGKDLKITPPRDIFNYKYWLLAPPYNYWT